MNYARTYGAMHQNPKVFPGYSLKRYVADVAELVGRFQPKSILDVGSGKGFQYLKLRLHERWGGLLPYCYDVGVRHISEPPERKFDAVICTDVLEHIEAGDVPGFLDQAFGFLDEKQTVFAFFSVACRPARKKTLPDGRNVHVTVRPPVWWREQIEDAIDRLVHPALLVRVCFEMEQEIRRAEWSAATAPRAVMTGTEDG